MGDDNAAALPRVTVDVTLHAVGSCRERRWLVDGSRDLSRIVFPALVAFIRHPVAGLILFDTGYGQALQRATSRSARLYRRLLPFHLPQRETLIEQLANQGFTARDVRAVFLSHFHPDHIGGLRDVAGAPIFCSRVGLDRLRHLSALSRVRAAFLPELLPNDMDSRVRAIEDMPVVPLGSDWEPFSQATDVLGDGSLLAVPLPGHAIGQYGLICRLHSGAVVFLVADAAWVRRNFTELALPAWPVRQLVGDGRSLVETLHTLHELEQRRPDVAIIPSHCIESHRAFAANGHGR